MRRVFLILIIISIIFVSCSRSSFTVSGATFDENEGNIRIKAYLDEGEEGENYSFILTSPDRDLVWKGDLLFDKHRLTSDYILLTPGASMPKGEYKLIIHLTNGTEIEESITY